MKRLLAGLTGLGLLAGGLVLAAPPVAADTSWTYPSGTFTFNDSFGNGTLTVSVTNLVIVPGGTATGYVRIDGKNSSGRTDWCSTTVFSGSTALWSSPSLSNPCTGSVDFAVDPLTGVLSATTGYLNMSSVSIYAQGQAAGAATAQAPAVVPITPCTLTYDASAAAINVEWGDNPDVKTYDISVSGNGTLTFPTTAGQGGGLGQVLIPVDLVTFVALTPGVDPVFRVTITGKRSDGAPIATCTTADVSVPAPGPPTIVGSPVAVAAGGLLTVNYSVPDSPLIQGVEYRLDNGPWLRPGGQAPVGGLGGSFTLSGITAKQVVLTMRTVTADPNVVIDGTATTVKFPDIPSSRPSAASGVATGSTAEAPVAAPPAAPRSTVSGTSNGAGTGANGALAAGTGDAGIDAPCLAADGTLYPNQYSTVGSQLTMAPNTHGMGVAKSFTVVDGALPPGMQLDRTFGVLFGVTTEPGSWTTTVKATFANGKTRTSQFLTRVDADPQTLQYAARNIGTLGAGMVIAPTTNAPAAGTTYTLVCGVLPPGMQLNAATGTVTGTPKKTVEMPTPLRIAESSSGGRAAASFILVVNPKGAASFSYPARPRLHAKKRAAIRPTITDAKSFIRFRTSRGKLPAGLRLNARTGVISGRPAHVGRTHTITIVGVTKAGALITAAPLRFRVGR